MKQIETQATSRQTATAGEIVLRLTDRVRLVFVPTLVKNTNNAQASVRGEFVYQKKSAKDQWISMADLSLGSLKSGEHYKLELRSEELLFLMQELRPLYGLVINQGGIPKGKKRFAFLNLGEDQLKDFADLHKDEAAAALLTLLRWIVRTPRRNEAVSRLASMSVDKLPDLNVIVGLAALKEAIEYWNSNRTNSEEEFWQKALADRAFVLSQLFSYPTVVIQEKAYMGGKQITNRGGNLVDFFSKLESTDSTVLIEIKTPQTALLGSEYRTGVFPFSKDISGAMTQVLRYRQSLVNQFRDLTSGQPKPLTIGEPKCLVIAGNCSELNTPDKKESFELQRERLQGVTVITYDEMFRKLETLMDVLQAT
jgi:hypothetical protein